MLRELYKMIHKKYYLALILLLLIPVLFGIGSFFDLPYMLEGNDLSNYAFDYCTEMQILIKYFYFLVIIFLACDVFSGELEEGQLRMEIVHVNSRRKILLQKFGALCLLASAFHVLFWAVNFGLYYLCDIKNNTSITVLSKNIEVCAGIFFGYLEAFFICIAITFLFGLFFKKIHTLIIVYFMWFICRYIDQIVSMKNIFPEFMADYLSHETSSVTSINISSHVINLLLAIAILFISIWLFQRKDIN